MDRQELTADGMEAVDDALSLGRAESFELIGVMAQFLRVFFQAIVGSEIRFPDT